MKDSNTNYLSLNEVLAIHFDLVRRYGGSQGLRDNDLLISAISRPQVSFGGADLYPNIYLKAAALMHSLIMKHPFVDGNKRTAISSAARFLYINGFGLEMKQKEMVSIVLDVESGRIDLKNLANWLKKHSVKV